MPRVRISLDLGPGVTVHQLADVIDDVRSVVDLAVRWSEAGIRSAAVVDVRRRLINATLPERAPQLSEDALFELDAYLRARHLWELLRTYPDDLIKDEWSQRLESPARAFFLAELISTLSGPPRLEEVAPEAFSQLLSVEVSRRLDGPPTVESMRYGNPWELVLAAGIGSFVGRGALMGLLVLLRDWRSGARLESAKADKKEAEAEDARARARMRNARASQEEAKAKILHQVSESLEDLSDVDLSVSHLLRLFEEDDEGLQALVRVVASSPGVEQLPELEAPE